ncbi:unnamed protein product [Camellia sinensis]
MFAGIAVSDCGDSTLGVPSHTGDNYECRNMKLLLKQQQKGIESKLLKNFCNHWLLPQPNSNIDWTLMFCLEDLMYLARVLS